MKKDKTIKVSHPGHEFHKNQRTHLNGKHVLITRTSNDTFWYKPLTLLDRLAVWLKGKPAKKGK